MRDYARMNDEQKAAYNEGLLDAMDWLQAKADSETHSIVAAGFRVAKLEVNVLRTQQIAAGPQA